MRRFRIRSLLIAVALCAVLLALYPWPQLTQTTAFEDLAEHPAVVRTVIRELERIPGGCSLEEFELELARMGNVNVPLEHFKDFEFYWSIDTGSSSPPRFIVAGSFAPSDGYRLTHATVNIVEERTGGWRTIWLADYASDTPDLLPPRIRGQRQSDG